MNVFWVIVGVAYLGLVTVAVGLSTWHAFRPRESSADRIADHIPDPRDTEITFLRSRVVELETMLHGVQRDQMWGMADMLKVSLTGGSTGLPEPEPGAAITGTTDDTTDDDELEPDWSDDFVTDTAGLPYVPPPPPGFPTP